MRLFAACLLAVGCAGVSFPAKAFADETADWPQWRGPNRDGVATSSPRLLDTWPKEGPPLVWNSEWIPSCEEGGCSHPVVAGGRVFVYSNAKRPVDGGDGYRFITDELLLAAGWLPELPDGLARKIEDAWANTNRPSSAGWEWYNPERCRKAGELDAFLAKTPELEKYIKAFLATLSSEDVAKYGDYIKRRFCIEAKGRWGVPNGQRWDTLARLSTLRDTRHRTRRVWGAALGKVSGEAVSLCENYPSYHFWNRVFSMADTVFCLDAATGRTIWRKDFAEDWATAVANPGRVQWWSFDSLGACGTPTVSGGKCYVAGALGLYCFSAKDGELIWQVKGEPAHSSVVVADGVVYDGGRGCAYDAEKGTPLWKNPLWPQGRWPVKDDQYRWNAPLLWNAGGKNYIITTDGGVSTYCCLDVQTGKAIWTLKTPIGLFTTIRGDLLIVPSPYGGGGTRAYRLTPAGPELLWKKGFADGSGDVIYQDHLYVLDRCVDMKTGETSWRSKIGIDSISPLVLTDGKVITQLGSSHQITKQWGGGYSLVMFKATPERYIELARFNPHACHMCSPAFAGGRLFVRLLDSVVCYDLEEHGVYLDGVAATRDTLTFGFKQTGGGLVAKDGNVKDVLIAEDSHPPKPAKAKIEGESIVVDIRGAAMPVSISCSRTNALAGRNGRPVPAFGWNVARVLRQRTCFENTILLTSDRPFDLAGGWNKVETFAVAGAKVTGAAVDAASRNIALTTDRAWKPGDAVTLTYVCFPVAQGEPCRETLTFTVAEPQRAAAKCLKTDETTSGTWKGVYGADGAVIAGDKASAPPSYAIVTPANKSDQIPWAASRADVRYPQASGEGKDRCVTGWHAPDELDVGVEITDGKEHQVAVYCLSGKTTALKVDVLDGDTMAVLDTQTVSGHQNGKYLVWNVKGTVILRFFNVNQQESTSVMLYGVFFDPAKAD
jgi:outer membrane protein assembly factor BamB